MHTLPGLARYIAKPDIERAAGKTGPRERAHGAVRRPITATTEAHARQENAKITYKARTARKATKKANTCQENATRTDKAPMARIQGFGGRLYGAVGREERREAS